MIFKFRSFLKNRLALKILIYILLFSSILSLSTTFVQLFFDYKENLKEVKKSILIIKETRLMPISLSLYNYNISQLDIQLESLLNLNGIKYLKITEKGGFEKTIGYFDKNWRRIIQEEVELKYIDTSQKAINLGKLQIIAKLDNPYQRIYKRLPVLLITNLIKALVTAVLIFGIIQYLITRHLGFIANYASNFSMEKLDTPLNLNRKPLFFIKEDELDQLTYAINNMRLRLKKDVEKQIEYEKKLLRSEERLRKLVNASRDAIVIHDKGSIIFANDQYYSMLGYKPDELVGVNIITKTMTPGSAAAINKRIFLKIFGSYEVTAQRKDMTTFPAELHTARMEFHGKRVRIVSIRDVTEYKKTQEEITKLRNFLKSIIDSMPSFIAGVDTEGRVTAWNTEAGKLTGVKAEKAMGEHLEKLIPNADITTAAFKKAVSARNIVKFPKIAVIRNGKEYLFDITIFPLAKGFEGAAIRADDITEKIHMEEMLIQSEKMLTVGGLAAGMAHEINNPLAGVLQNLQVIENRLKTNMEKNLDAAVESGITMTAMQKYMEKREIFSLMDSISKSGKRAATIVRDMLSFARKSDSNFMEYDLKKIMDTTIELAEKEYDLKTKFDFKKIDIVREYDKIPRIFCDRNKIQQVLLNLLKNGAQAMAEMNDSKNQPCLILRILKKKDQVRIEIKDNGPGIDKKIQKKIFEPFFTTKPVGVGTGLGLSVSYFIICENHKGRMGVNSLPGKGTTFYIELPIT
jgi:PAS domain S-box-containing protein